MEFPIFCKFHTLLNRNNRRFKMKGYFSHPYHIVVKKISYVSISKYLVHEAMI